MPKRSVEDVTDIREGVISGYPVLYMTVDGIDALIVADFQGAPERILGWYGAVYLGPEFEDDYSVKIPADKDISQRAATLRGFTNSEKVVEPVRAWLNKVSGVNNDAA